MGVNDLEKDLRGYNPTVRRAAAKKADASQTQVIDPQVAPGTSAQPTIASEPIQTQPPVVVTPQAPQQAAPPEVRYHATYAAPPVTQASYSPPSPPATQPSPLPALSKEMLMELARQAGFEVSEPKKEFIKHTYSVTKDQKNNFKEYCEVLGIAMQDGLYEALEMFFQKHAEDFKRIKSIKR